MSRDRPEFCVECGLSFGLVDRFRGTLNSCVDCAAKLRPSSFGECEKCHRLIEIGDKIHLEWVKFCKECTRRYNRDEEMRLKCDTVAPC